MEEIYSQWREELTESGLLKPGEEIDNMKLAEMYQDYQVEKMKSLMSGSFASLIPDDTAAEKPDFKIPAKPDMERPETIEKVSTSDARTNVDIRDGMKAALHALLNVAKGANYCMFVVDRAWINFRYRERKDNLHLQVAGNQYISPMELSKSDIGYLEKMGINPEEGSNEIWAIDFDDTPRDINKIVDIIIEIFNEVYHIVDETSAYVELELAKGEDESIRKEIARKFDRRDGKKFKFKWTRNL